MNAANRFGGCSVSSAAKSPRTSIARRQMRDVSRTGCSVRAPDLPRTRLQTRRSGKSIRRCQPFENWCRTGCSLAVSTRPHQRREVGYGRDSLSPGGRIRRSSVRRQSCGRVPAPWPHDADWMQAVAAEMNSRRRPSCARATAGFELPLVHSGDRGRPVRPCDPGVRARALDRGPGAG